MMGLKAETFAAIRRILGRGLTQAEVDAINVAEGTRVVPDAPSQPETSRVPLAIGGAGIALIKEFEGCGRRIPDGRLAAYPDPGTGGAPWTIGWGATGPGITSRTIWTQHEADARLVDDLKRYSAQVADALGSALTATSQMQFDALVSFHYNTGAIATATLTRKHKAGDFAGAAAEFGRWVNSGGRKMAGLVRRRAAEAALYRKGSK